MFPDINENTVNKGVHEGQMFQNALLHKLNYFAWAVVVKEDKCQKKIELKICQILCTIFKK